MNIAGTITTLEEFNNLVEGIRGRRAYTQAFGLPYRSEFYRGQVDAGWTITPGLSRDLKAGDQVREAETLVIEHFKARIQAENYLHKIFLHANPRQYQNDWAWLMQAQHYGIPTRLLDWTLKPEVALYFAVDNPNFDHVSAQFLVIYYPLFEIMIEGGFQEQFFETKPSALNNTWLLNPSFYAEADHDQAIGEVRRARQHGKFTIQSYDWSFVGLDAQANFLKSYDSTIKTYEPVIEKYIIPAQFKAQLRLDLIAREWYCEWLYKEEDDVINRIKGECKTILADYVSARIS